MNNEELKILLSQKEPSIEFEENKQFLTLVVSAEKLHDFAVFLRNDSQLQFDYLFCLSGVDKISHLSVVYHLQSTCFGHTLVVKTRLKDRENPQVPTVCDIWKTAEFHEREVFDLFGIVFTNHPDLRRIFLDDDWKGYPLRKDYVDEVNMVNLIR